MTTHAWLATGRVANLPTVWSNVLVAFFLARSWIPSGNNSLNIECWSLASALITASLLYVGGCFLGDFRDLAFDRQHRPNRPLPQGILKPSTVHLLAWSFITTALVLASFNPPALPFAGSLAIAITSYAVFHKKNRILALTLMGSCRASLILYALAVGKLPLKLPLKNPLEIPPGILSITLALTVGIYTIFLSSVAATESNPQQISFRKPLLAGMIALPLVAHFIISGVNSLAFGVIFGVTFLIYTLWIAGAFEILSQSKPAFVSRALVGFCLLDACLATAYSTAHSSIQATSLVLVCLALFIGALGLQKLAPAT